MKFGIINIVEEVTLDVGTTTRLQIMEIRKSTNFLIVKKFVAIILNAKDLSIVQLATFVHTGKRA